LASRLKLPSITPWQFEPAMWEHMDRRIP
jgi:hypothetical protein